jgi:TonB-linked SusC/RagA family outer membrane protein
MRKLYLFFLGICLIFSQVGFSQANPVSGIVKDASGSPIVGASVKVKGSKSGTVTDANGHFTLNVKTGQKLEVSAIGFIQSEADASAGMNVTLSQDVQSMSEVIVTGVAGATSKKKMTVSVTKVTAEQLNNVPATSLSSALTGKVAGLKASSYGGQPGESLDILLRGDNNLNNVSSSPLILLDGVIMSGSLADINADDVESIEVVKGAAASALYGSRAGNGVISVITKRGKGLALNKPTITVRNELGFQNLSHYLDVAQSHPYALASDWETAKGKYTKYAGVTYPADYMGAGYSTGISGNRPIDADHYMDNPYGVNRNQQAEFFQTGKNYTNFVSVANRTEKNNVYLSFENNAQQGVVALTDGYKRQNFRINLDQQIAPWLKLSASNLFINRNVQYPGGGVGLFYAIARQERDVNLNQVNPDGQPYYLRSNHFNQEATNPLYPLYKQKRNEKTRRWMGNYTANVKFTKWANLDLTQTIEIQNYRYSSINPKDYWSQSGGTPATNNMSYTNGGMSQSTNESNTQNTQATLNLSHDFGDLKARTKLSYLYENRRYESNYASGSKFVISGIETLENFANPADISSYSENEKAQNYFAILGLDWRDKLLFDGMFRYDGSSLFGSDARWNPYYRLSGAYRISQDVNIPGIDELKIRAAHGTAGIRPGFDWQYEIYSLSNGFATAQQKGNSALKPSKTRETEIGLNVDFLKRFNFEATYAKSLTDDQFLNVPLIPFLNDGYNRQWQNAGSVKSNTLEFTLGANWLKSQNFSWNTNFVFSKVRQKIDELPIAPYLYADGNMGDQSLFYVKANEVYGSMYGYKMVRTLDEMANQLPGGKSISDYEVNNEGYVVPAGSQGTVSEIPVRVKENGADWYGRIGDGNPDFIMGITNTLKFKGFTLYFLLDWKQGGDVYNGKDQRLSFNLTSARMDMTNVSDGQKKAYDYWFTGMYDKNDPNAYWVEDGTYMKLREVSLAYSIPSKVLNNISKGAIKGVNAKVIGRNLLTFTGYKGYDPEVGSLRMPYDGIYMNPNYRNIAFSLSLDF